MFDSRQWQNIETISLENRNLRVIVAPSIGGKIVSLYDKQAAHEWLLQPTRKVVVPPHYGDNYVESDPNSWDEMFPTINTCQYPADGKHKGVNLPDHGEVWSLPWEIERGEDDSVVLSTRGKQLPYILTRKVYFSAENKLSLDYSLANLSREPLYGLWASHALFTVNENTELILPSHITELYNVLDIEPWGSPGTVHAYPVTTTPDGTRWDLRRIRPTTQPTFRKFYVNPNERVAYVRLSQLDKNAQITMSWDARDLPYFGIWIDEGVYTKTPVLGLEPSNGFYDGLDIAYEKNRIAPVQGKSTVTWSLVLEVKAGTACV
jgi:galactose mutarotase-like enzyme